MHLTELLARDRIAIVRDPEGPAPTSMTKGEVIRRVAALLAKGTTVGEADLHRVLEERETVQSTGIGDGVAIPHGASTGLETQCAALLLLPNGVAFDAIDGAPVHIVFAVVGPKRATGEHLKTLARISRLLRNRALREQMLNLRSSDEVFGLIESEEAASR
jgi:PTS system nitrogen regulatory IIA component